MKTVSAIVVSLCLLFILGFILHRSIHHYQDEIPLFTCGGMTTNSNSCLISIVISNRSQTTIDFYVGNPVVKSNGVWEAFSHPQRTRLSQLSGETSCTVIVTGRPDQVEMRVPVMWGFGYTGRANHLQQWKEDVIAWMRMHDTRGRGALYTNFVDVIQR